jgi:hypothetical protein
MRKMIKHYFIAVAFMMCLTCCARKENRVVSENGGYLFAHMSNNSYGSLFYSVSDDGTDWRLLNKGQRICDYRGHSDFCFGKDGRYYMIGIEAGTQQPLLWATKNLITWGIEQNISKDVFDTAKAGYKADSWYGAPKMYYDADSKQYIITWHAADASLSRNGNEEHDKPYWRSIRTFYVLTSDFREFTQPHRLFHFTGKHENMPTMDVIIRKIDGKYYAFIKDERWPGDVSDGYKAIHIAKSDNLTGPYENPGPAVTDTWHEAQTLVRNPDDTGWYLFAENYPHKYDLYESVNIEGPWKKKEISAVNIRHGSVVRVDEPTYRAILTAYQ